MVFNMAEIQKEVYELNVDYQANAETVLWDSENRGISGKITCITINFENHAINVNTMMARHSVITMYSTHSFDQQTIECGVRYTAASTIEYATLQRIYSGSKLVNNGICDVVIKIKSDRDLHGTIKGTVEVSFTEDEEEQDKQTTLSLNQNALSDWMKESTVNKGKFGISSTNQFPISINFEQGKTQQLIWTNRGVDNNYIEKISISLNLDVTNNADSQRVIDLDFDALYGSDDYTDNIEMWIMPPGELRNLNTATSYEKDVIPNDGLAIINIILKNTQTISGRVDGVVILETKSSGMAVSNNTGEATTDTSVQNILNMLNGDNLSVGGSTADTPIDVDSFMSAYSGEGYEDDMSMLSSENYTSQAMSNDLGERILQLEQRITALEERMNIVGVGGDDIDWFDGGADGTDDAWGIDEWYKQNESRISQTESDAEITYNLFNDVSNPENIFYTYQVSNDKVINSFDYYFMLSFKYTGEECIGEKVSMWIETDERKELETFTLDDSGIITTREFTDYLSKQNFETVRAGFSFVGEPTQAQLNDLFSNLTGKVSGNVNIVLSDKVEIGSQEVTETQEVDFNVFTDQSNPNNAFCVINPQSVNKTIERVEYTLTFSYQYTGTECDGKPLELYALNARYDGASIVKDMNQSTKLDLSNKQFSKVFKGTIIRENSFMLNNGNSQLTFCINDMDYDNWTQAQKADIFSHIQGKIFGTIKYTLS